MQYSVLPTEMLLPFPVTHIKFYLGSKLIVVYAGFSLSSLLLAEELFYNLTSNVTFLKCNVLG